MPIYITHNNNNNNKKKTNKKDKTHNNSKNLNIKIKVLQNINKNCSLVNDSLNNNVARNYTKGDI